jgi:hypothetical protein
MTPLAPSGFGTCKLRSFALFCCFTATLVAYLGIQPFTKHYLSAVKETSTAVSCLYGIHSPKGLGRWTFLSICRPR